jgi:predicted ester cyclase
MASLALSRSRNRLPIRPLLQSAKTRHVGEHKEYDDHPMLCSTGAVDTDDMPAADTARRFVLTLHHAADGAPYGTFRVVGQPGETAFEGWIELIGLITEARGTNMDHATAMRKAYENISAGDISGFGELVADDFVEHEELPGLAPTKQGALEYFQMLLTSFPDLRMDVEDLIVEGDKAVARVLCTATHDGEFMDIAPTGKKVDMQIIDIMRFDDDGLVCEHWGIADMFSLMQQLGAVPA